MSTTNASEAAGAAFPGGVGSASPGAAFAGCVGIDWGTTHRRVTVLGSDGAVRARHDDDQGALACQGRFAASIATLYEVLPSGSHALPLVMAGMIGSSVGWQEAPYMAADQPLRALAGALVPVADAPPGARWCIVPGVCFGRGRLNTDVMRGEETQLLGALLSAPDGGDGTWVLPGTHSKWVTLHAGRITSLRTYLTGELFALLGAHGTLANALKAPADPALAQEGFAAGVAAASDPGLSHQLFGLRARILTGGLPAGGGLAYLSGLLIGAEWHDLERRGLLAHGPVRVIASAELSTHHAACARLLGHVLHRVDPQPLAEAAWRYLAR